MDNHSINWDAYQKGFESARKHRIVGYTEKNPYKKYSIEWKSWNRGWNTGL